MSRKKTKKTNRKRKKQRSCAREARRIVAIAESYGRSEDHDFE